VRLGLTTLLLSPHHLPVLYRIFTVDHKLLPVGRTVIVTIEVSASWGSETAGERQKETLKRWLRERSLEAAETHKGPCMYPWILVPNKPRATSPP
jgi:hypothetical protein